MEDKLKPCPFCNTKAVTDKYVIDKEKRGWGAHCHNEKCINQPHTPLFDTEAEAVEAWNNRPIENDLQAKIDNFREWLNWVSLGVDKEAYQDEQSWMEAIKANVSTMYCELHWYKSEEYKQLVLLESEGK